MSVKLDGTTQYLTHPAAPLPDLLPAGHTISGWATRGANTTMSLLANGLGETAGVNQPQIQLNTGVGIAYASHLRTTVELDAATTTGTPSVAVFSSGIAVLQADDNLRAYFNGVGGSPLVRVAAPGGMTEVRIGTRNGSNIGFFWNGYVAEVGIWNRELNAQEIQNLAINNWAPSMIPNGLVAYWPLLNDFNDAVGTFHMGEVGGVVIDPFHPPGMIYPGAPTGVVTSRGFANMDRNFLNMRG